ncbi:MAG: peptidylprolyl isomerase [Actinobacteria bacterium]|nr:peptidylprolyl isomerase [Actinomycetota bacterium]
MQKIIKVITITTFIAIFSINLSPTSNAAQNKKVPEVVCKKTSAKVHSIKNITPPEVKPPFTNKTFTLTTNCGDIVIEANAKSAPSYRDENLPQAVESNYPAGIVAMYNKEPNTNGSQFFIVYEDTSMRPEYTIWGKVTKGLEIVKAIAKEGVADGTNDGLPKQTIAIERVKVR